MTFLGILANQPGHDGIQLVVEANVFTAGSGDDQWRARLIDQDGVHLVHDGIAQLALHLVFHAECHVVTQVVEPQLVVGGIDDITGIVGALFLRPLPRQHHAHRQTHCLIDRTHPFGVPSGQVLIDGDHMHAMSRQSIQAGCKGGDQRLALTSTHLGNLALMQRETT